MNTATIAILSAILIDNIYTHLWTKYILKYSSKFSAIQILQSTYLSGVLYIFITLFHKKFHSKIIDSSVPSHIHLTMQALIPSSSKITLLSSMKITLLLWAVFVVPTIDFFLSQNKRHQYLLILFGSCLRYALITAVLSWNL